MRSVPAHALWQTQWQPRTSFRALFQRLALSVAKSEEPQDYELKDLQRPIRSRKTSREELSCPHNTISDIAVLFPSTYDTPRVPNSSRASPASVPCSPSPTLNISDSTTTTQRARQPEQKTAALFSEYQAPEPSEEAHRPSETSDIAHTASKDDPTSAPEIPSAPHKSKASYRTTTELLIRKLSFQCLVREIAHTTRTFLSIPGTSSIIPSISDMAVGPDSPSVLLSTSYSPHRVSNSPEQLRTVFRSPQEIRSQLQ